MKSTLLAAGLAFAMLATPAARAAEGDTAIEMFGEILKTGAVSDEDLRQILAGFYSVHERCGVKLNERILDRVAGEFVGPGAQDEFEEEKRLIALGWHAVSPHQQKVACDGIRSMAAGARMLAK